MNRRNFLLRTGQSALFASLSLGTFPIKAGVIKTDFLLSDLEKLMPQLMGQFKIPGVSAAIIREGESIWHKGFGVKNSQHKEPVDPETIFEAASISKTVFAYAVMKLCEKGVLSLDTPLYRYLPEPFLEGDERVRVITARHVLSHQTGFQDLRTSDVPLKIHFEPGTDFMYSGEGYYYLQSVVTQLTGKVDATECASYEADLKVCATDIGQYLVQNVLVPHGMHNSGYVWNDMLAKNVATPHSVEGKPLNKWHPTRPDMARYASAGGLMTTAGDFSKFLVGLFTPKNIDPFRLNPKSQEEMLRPQIKLREDQRIDGASSWALGWAVRERPNGNIFLHSGGQSGFRSLMMVSLKRKSGFVILTNSDNGGYLFENKDLADRLDQLFV
jgi:CubicO group peptidase (beta-lactamase class C family)